MSSKTRTDRKFSSVGWRTGGWTLPPSMTTSEPSTGEHGVERWIASLLASPANHSRQPGSDLAKMTNATSGRSLDAALLLYDPASSSLRTSQASFSLLAIENPTLSRFSGSLPGWVTWDGRGLWEQEMPEHPIDGTDGSAWPTVKASDGEHGGPNMRGSKGDLPLPSAAAMWPTPDGQVIEGDTAWKERREREKAKGRNGNGFGLTIAMAASLWPTPDTTNVGDGTPYEMLQANLLARRERTRVAVQEGRVKAGSGRSENLAMAVQAPMWATPSTMDHIERHGMRPSRAATGRTTDYLSEQLENWPTPTASDKNGPGLHGQGQPDLRTTVTWATPKARDYKDGADPAATIPTNGLLGRQAPRTAMAGPESSQSDPTSPPQSPRRLNPRFVEWLMGFPTGWTDLQPLETPSSGDKPDSHGMS